jgi:hypothetical protein
VLHRVTVSLLPCHRALWLVYVSRQRVEVWLMAPVLCSQLGQVFLLLTLPRCCVLFFSFSSLSHAGVDDGRSRSCSLNCDRTPWLLSTPSTSAIAYVLLAASRALFVDPSMPVWPFFLAHANHPGV